MEVPVRETRMIGPLIEAMTIAFESKGLNKGGMMDNDISVEINRLTAKVKRLKAENDVNDRFATKVTKECNRLRKALEKAREVFRNSERGSRLGMDNEIIAEALLIGFRGCEEALKDSS